MGRRFCGKYLKLYYLFILLYLIFGGWFLSVVLNIPYLDLVHTRCLVGVGYIQEIILQGTSSLAVLSDHEMSLLHLKAHKPMLYRVCEFVTILELCFCI